ncbi:MAG: hypothetical protein AB4352_28525 [Hormoscilla sp.]
MLLVGFQPTSAISRGFEPTAGRQRREKILSAMPDRLLPRSPSIDGRKKSIPATTNR